MTEFQSWLIDPANKSHQRLLIECDNDTETLRVSDRGYQSVTHPYPAWIEEDNLPDIELALEEATTLGGFKLLKPLYITDNWQSYKWVGHECRLKFGDDRWLIEDYKTIAVAVIQSVTPDDEGSCNFTLKTAGKKYEIPVQSETENGEYKLLLLGLPKQVKPQFIENYPLIKYRFNDGPFNGTIAVEDIGLDVTNHCSIDYATGYFTINPTHSPAGAIRINVLTNAVKTAPQIAQFISTKHGLGNVTVTGFEPWQTDATMAEVIRSNVSVKVLFDNLMLSLGGFFVPNALGEPELIIPKTTGATFELNENNTGEDLQSLSPIPAAKKLVVNYGKNHDTLNPSVLATSLTQTEIEALGREYKSVEQTTIATDGEDLISYDTLLANQSDANLLLADRATVYAKERPRWGLSVFDLANMMRLGNAVTINRSDITGTAAYLSNIQLEYTDTEHGCEVVMHV